MQIAFSVQGATELYEQAAVWHWSKVVESEGVEVRGGLTAPIQLSWNPATHVQFSTHASNFSWAWVKSLFTPKVFFFSFNHEPKLTKLKGEFHHLYTKKIQSVPVTVCDRSLPDCLVLQHVAMLKQIALHWELYQHSLSALLWEAHQHVEVILIMS